MMPASEDVWHYAYAYEKHNIVLCIFTRNGHIRHFSTKTGELYEDQI